MDHTLALIGRIHQGDKEARDTLFSENMGLVYSVARRFLGRGVEMEDLFQIGSIGLLKAVDHFNPEFDVKFSTYAVPIIMGEIKRYFRDDGSMRISRSLKEGYLQMMKAKEQLVQKLLREPTYKEIADALEKDVEEVILAFEANQYLYSLDETIYENDGSPILLEDRISTNKQEDVVMKLALKSEITQLSEREKLLLHYRYDLGMKQEYIAEKLHVSQVQVSRMEKKVLEKLKKRLVEG